MPKNPSTRPIWSLKKTETLGRYRIFEVDQLQMYCLPHKDRPELNRDFFVIRSPDWINVVATDENDHVVMIEQFRYGLQCDTLEIPGGLIDPGESPLAAAKRELAEETGYTSSDWLELGRCHPNPAIQSNVCHTFLARKAKKTQAPNFDADEFCILRLVPFPETFDHIASGEITHSLVMVGLNFEMARRQRTPVESA